MSFLGVIKCNLFNCSLHVQVKDKRLPLEGIYNNVYTNKGRVHKKRNQSDYFNSISNRNPLNIVMLRPVLFSKCL